jgi:UDP-N-acetylmuramoylalanine--D-glutamate ligase
VQGTFRHGATILGSTADCPLPGAFQLENVLVALGLAEALGARPADTARAVAGLTGLDHRLQFLGTRGGRRIHDNGVSSTPDSTVAALRSLPTGLVALMGGRSKDLPLDELARVAAERAAHAVCFGEAREELAAALRGSGVHVVVEEQLKRALGVALALAPEGGDVLFSPACTSFDAFPNFRARALAFRAALPAEQDA